MNLSILTKDAQNFINTNLTVDTSKLAFKGSPFIDISVQELIHQIVSKNKCKDKLPTWFGTPNIYYPPKLNIEQTSSEITANYKASLLKGKTMIDLTGGLGVDSFYFAKTFKEVTHCEIDKELSDIASYNYKRLDASNIRIVNEDGISYLMATKNQYDCIYIDPSRRNEVKGKVFRLADCTPNVPDHLELLFEYTDIILIKTSPLLDLKIGIEELKYVHEIHIVAVENEVKELLFLLQKDATGDITFKTINFLNTSVQQFNFKTEEADGTINYANPLHYIYEPNKAIYKSGAFNLVAQRFNLFKISTNTHLYTSDKLKEFPGSTYEVISQIPYNYKKLKEALPVLQANIKIRNFPDAINTIKKKMKLTDGGEFYVFFTSNQANQLLVFITKKIKF